MADKEKGTVAELRKKFEADLVQAEELYARQEKDGELSEDNKKELITLLNRCEELDGEIKMGEKIGQFRADWSKKADPAKGYQHPDAEPEEQDTEGLSKMLSKPYKSKKREMLASKDYKYAFEGAVLSDLRKNDYLSPTGWKTMSESVGASGGYLVPTAMHNEIVKNPPVDLVLWPRIQKVTAGGDSIVVPVLNQGTNWEGGTTGTWTAEGADKTESNVDFMQAKIEAFTCATYIGLTKQLIQDSAFDVMGFVQTKIAEAIMVAIETSLFTGTGIGQPTGFLLTPGTTCATVARAGANAIAWADIISLFETLPRQDWKGAIFTASPTAWGEIMGWTDTANRPIMSVDPQGAFADSVRGKSLHITDNQPTLGTVGDLCLINPRFILALVRENLEILASNVAYDAMFKNLTYIRAEMRVGAKPVKPMALVALTDAPAG